MWEWWSRKSKVERTVWTSLHNSHIKVAKYKIMLYFLLCWTYQISNEAFSLRCYYNYCNKINIMLLILWQPCRYFFTAIPTLGVLEIFLSSSLRLMNFWEFLSTSLCVGAKRGYCSSLSVCVCVFTAFFELQTNH